MNLKSKMTVNELLLNYPSVIDVFLKRKMLCVGCPAQAFHTLEDVACIYGIPFKELRRELQDTLEGKEEI